MKIPQVPALPGMTPLGVKPAKLGGYLAIISEATGLTDPAVLAEIEDTMRHVIFHSTLDWQTRAQLKRGAKQALAVVLALKEQGIA